MPEDPRDAILLLLSERDGAGPAAPSIAEVELCRASDPVTMFDPECRETCLCSEAVDPHLPGVPPAEAATAADARARECDWSRLSSALSSLFSPRSFEISGLEEFDEVDR